VLQGHGHVRDGEEEPEPDLLEVPEGGKVVHIVKSASSKCELGAEITMMCCRGVDTYVTVKKNQNQICWKFQKVGRLFTL
jgi:hypothetical protein